MVEIFGDRKCTLATLLLGILLLLALLLRLGAAFAFPNILWPDEIFQSLEQAHRLTYGYGIIPWEFRSGTRSWLFPGVLAGIMHLTTWMGDGSRGYLAGVTIFLCLLSLAPILVAFFWGYRVDGLVAAVITAGVCSIWFELVYFAPKAFNEVVAAHLFLPGVYLGVHGKGFQMRSALAWASPRFANGNAKGERSSASLSRLFLMGCLFGLALTLRIHLLPAVLFAVAYVARKDWSGKWLPIGAGILAPILVCGVLDAFTWSYPFQSFWTNIWVNVVQSKSKIYGVSPWYGYFNQPLNNWSFALVPIALLLIMGARRSPILAWLVIVIVLSHSIFAHKEYRFIYPALPMVSILTGLGTAQLVRRWRSRWSSSRETVMTVLVCLVLWSATSAVLATRFDSFRKPHFSMLWAAAQTTNWQNNSGNLLSFQRLSTEPTLCGVGFAESHWSWSGGYTYLHRNVPIFFIEQSTEFDRVAPSFNYLVSNVPVPPQHQNAYALQQCWGNTCLYKRSGSCTKKTGYHINQVLKQRGE